MPYLLWFIVIVNYNWEFEFFYTPYDQDLKRSKKNVKVLDRATKKDTNDMS